MNCKEIIEQHLKEKGFDGLFNIDKECGCHLIDMMPCGEPWISECESGYYQTVKEGDPYLIGIAKFEPCPVCKKPRQKQGNAFLVCPHCKDDIPF